MNSRIRDRTPRLLPLAAAVVALGFSPGVMGLGTETFGNAPIIGPWVWEGVEPVVNHSSRIYGRWVNGTDILAYSGHAATLNEVLSLYAQIEAERLEVVLMPGPWWTWTFDDEIIACDWQMTIPGEFSRAAVREGLVSSDLERAWPRMTIPIGMGGIALEDIEIPEGVTLLQQSDLIEPLLGRLESENPRARGRAAIHLAWLTPLPEEVLGQVVEMLEDEDPVARWSAALALSWMGGPEAQAARPILEAQRDEEDPDMTAVIQRALERMEPEVFSPQNTPERRALLQEIRQFLMQYAGSSPE